MRDPRTGRSVSLGIVIADDNNGSHYEVRAGNSDIWVRVELQPEERPVWCRLAGPWGGASIGLYVVPRVGAEVVVLTPNGDTAADPILVAGLSTGSVPTVGVDVVIMAGAGVVKLGADTGTGAVAMAANVEARLNRLETQARYYAPSTGGPTSTAMLPTIEYLADYPTDPAVIVNPTHAAWVANPLLKHVHAPGYPTNPCPSAATPTVNSTVPGSDGGCAATKVQGI